jgi:ABC-type sugar transport system permease subunit
MDKNKTHYFRDKQIVYRGKWYQKILRPLAVWVANQEPQTVILNGLIFAIGWAMLRLLVVHFYSFVFALPWVIMAIAIALALLSKVLREGGK